VSLISTFWDMRRERSVVLARAIRPALDLAPGLALTLAVSLVAVGLQSVEQKLFGRAWVESLALAILVGAVVRSLWTPHARWRAGVVFSARTLLELAVVLLGASVSAATLMALGWALPASILALVAASIGGGFLLGRLFRLPTRMALLVACGNSICGNSAIAAVAPVIGAEAEDVTCAIAFTAVLGVVTVVGLPFLGRALGMSGLQFGVLSGLTVYAVPQVLAAAAPMGAAAVHFGTLVKLVRVLMLGPVCFVLSLMTRRLAAQTSAASARTPTIEAGAPAVKLKPVSLVPWFIIGFLGLAGLRSLGAIPAVVLPPVADAASVLTILSMAALGLCTDLRAVAKAGPRIVAVVSLSLLGLGAVSLGLIHLLHLA
jgi:uncharacterized integral membrane protein (TIGR00698 family)